MKQIEFAGIVLAVIALFVLANSFGILPGSNNKNEHAIIPTVASSTAENLKEKNAQNPVLNTNDQGQTSPDNKNLESDFVIENGSVFWIGHNKNKGFKVNLTSNFGADADTFHVLNSVLNSQSGSAGVYAADKNQVYLSNASGYHVLNSADVQTFSIVAADYQVSKDKNYVYLGAQISPDLDPATIKVLRSPPPGVQNPTGATDVIYLQSQGNIFAYNLTNANQTPVLILIPNAVPVYFPPGNTGQTDWWQTGIEFVADPTKVYCNGAVVQNIDDIPAKSVTDSEIPLIFNSDTNALLCM